MTLVIGIDPGVHGAVAILYKDGPVVWDLPTIMDGKREALTCCPPCDCWRAALAAKGTEGMPVDPDGKERRAQISPEPGDDAL